jgi:hypothetical protein
METMADIGRYGRLHIPLRNIRKTRHSLSEYLLTIFTEKTLQMGYERISFFSRHAPPFDLPGTLRV